MGDETSSTSRCARSLPTSAKHGLRVLSNAGRTRPAGYAKALRSACAKK